MAAARNNPKAFSDWYELDYFRRPRHPGRTAWVVLGTMAVCAAAVAVPFAWPGGRMVYQAGPLSNPHAFLADNCGACHTGAFLTASRLLPDSHDVRATPDDACLKCHDAGAHNPHQTQFTGPTGQAAGCAACHREHKGDVSLARLDDAHCTDCHAALEVKSGSPHRFEKTITRFDTDHPPLGQWRGGPLTDPGTLKFNHKVHLELADKLKDVPAARLGAMAGQLQLLKDQSCSYCHQPDGERRYMLPVRYESHCAACHPLTVPVAGSDPLPHPQPGETAAVVRGALLERFWKQIAAAGPPAAAPVRPPVLERGLPPLSADGRERVRQLARQAEDRLFAPDGGDVLRALERPLFQFKGESPYCHVETTTPTTRPDGLPTYAPPSLQNRWADGVLPHDRFSPATGGRRSDAEQADRDRWFPYARFGHESHRALDCTACHAAAASTKTSDVLMPTIDVCRQCHNPTTAGVRSDCLECHAYHDRGREPHGLRGRLTVDEVLRGGRGP